MRLTTDTIPAAVALSALLLALLSGCQGIPQHGQVTGRSTVVGMVQRPQLVVETGAALVARGDLVLDITGDIYVRGDILPKDGRNASITLISRTGSIYVDGSIRSGDGRSRRLVRHPTVAKGQDGGHGGSILLTASQGDVQVSGSLRAGDGGDGGSAFADGLARLVSAESGAGGNGGDIRIDAGSVVDVAHGQGLRAGIGGNSSWAIARVQGSPGALQRRARDNGAFDADELAALASVAAVLARTERVETLARSGLAGKGGEVSVTLQQPQQLLIDAPVRSGNGGVAGVAYALHGHRAKATAGAGGFAGDVLLQAAGVTVLDLTTPSPGSGGRSGGAAAFALNKATAETGDGGRAGAYRQPGATLATGRAGNANALAVRTLRPPAHKPRPVDRAVQAKSGTGGLVSLP